MLCKELRIETMNQIDKATLSDYAKKCLKELRIALRLAEEESKFWKLLPGSTQKKIWQTYDHLLNVEKCIFALNEESKDPLLRSIKGICDENRSILDHLSKQGMGREDGDMNGYTRMLLASIGYRA